MKFQQPKAKLLLGLNQTNIFGARVFLYSYMSLSGRDKKASLSEIRIIILRRGENNFSLFVFTNIFQDMAPTKAWWQQR